MSAVEKKLKKMKPFYSRHNMKYVGLFGSYSRGGAGRNSDVDLLVRFSKPVSLFDIINTESLLEKELGKKVDLVTERSLSRFMKKDVLDSVRVVYEA